jgi:hypothetical protein
MHGDQLQARRREELEREANTLLMEIEQSFAAKRREMSQEHWDTALAFLEASVADSKILLKSTTTEALQAYVSELRHAAAALQQPIDEAPQP